MQSRQDPTQLELWRIRTVWHWPDEEQPVEEFDWDAVQGVEHVDFVGWFDSQEEACDYAENSIIDGLYLVNTKAGETLATVEKFEGVLV